MNYRQPDRRFVGRAYEYLRDDDDLPTLAQIEGEDDPLCRIKLFQTGSRFTYYIAAATEYDGIEGPVLTGFCVSPFSPAEDEWGDQDLRSIANVRVRGLPPERDLHYKPMRLSEIRAQVAARCVP